MIDIVPRAASLPADEFNALNTMAGAAGSHARMSQREADPRWRVRYVRWLEAGRLRAGLPVYQCRGPAWPDRAYDPSAWEWPDGVQGDGAPGRGLQVGGCSDLRTALHVDREAEPGHWRRLLAAIATLAEGDTDGDGNFIVLPYVYQDNKDALAQASMGHIAWAELGREAHLDGVAAPDWEERLSSRVRYVLRRDRRLIAEAGVRGRVCRWAEIADSACALIAEHNTRKGKIDHPDFVRLRHDEWDECPSVELLVFSVRAGAVSGVLTAFIWNGQLELYEIGLGGDAGADRLAAYLSLVFHEPLRLARSRGLAHIRAGRAAELAKGARGARFVHLYGGVLSARDAGRLAMIP